MIDQLTSQHRKRTFFVISGLAIVVFVLVRRFVLPWLDPAWTDVGKVVWVAGLIDQLIPTLIGTLVAVAFVLYLWPPVRQAEVKVVPSNEIRPLLLEAVAKTRTKYWFCGRTASFVAGTVLPQLIAKSRETRASIEVHIQLLDPMDGEACEAYAAYRKKIGRTDNGKNLSSRDVQLAVAANILAIYRARDESLLEPRVYLRKTFALYRIDLSDTCMILTREDPSDSGLKCDAGTPMYDLFFEDMKASEAQGASLPNVVLSVSEALGPDGVRLALKSLGIELGLSDAETGRILTKALTPRDPYAK